MTGLLAGFLGKGPDIIDAFGNAIDKVTTTDEERAIADRLKSQMQVDINKIEAQHVSLFVAGWRPAIGWVCALGLGFTVIVGPLLTWFLQVVTILTQGNPVWLSLPSIRIPEDALMEVLLGMLGIAGLRTFEKYKGKTK